MNTQTRDTTRHGVYHKDCDGGEMLLYTDDDGHPVPSRAKQGCLRAYCDGCGAVGPVNQAVATRMNTGMRVPKARIKLDPMSTSQAQLGLAGSRR